MILLASLFVGCYDLSNPNDPNSRNYGNTNPSTTTIALATTTSTSTTTTIALTPQTTIPAGPGTYRIEAEDAHFDAPLVSGNAYGGASSGFYVESFYEGPNRVIKWVADLVEAGSYSIKIGYACAMYGSPQNIHFYLNGVLTVIPAWVQQDDLLWSVWGTIDFTLNLVVGLNYLEVRSGGLVEARAVNLDYLEISKP